MPPVPLPVLPLWAAGRACAHRWGWVLVVSLPVLLGVLLRLRNLWRGWFGVSVRWRTYFIPVGGFGVKGGAWRAMGAADWKGLWAAGFQLAVGFKVQVEACLSPCSAFWLEIRSAYSGRSQITGFVPGAARASLWYVATGTWNDKPFIETCTSASKWRVFTCILNRILVYHVWCFMLLIFFPG